MKIIETKFLNSNFKPMEKKTIVIIEDELIIAMDLKRILEHEGFNVIINFKNYNFTETINDIHKYNPSLLIFGLGLLACGIKFYTSFYISLMLLFCWTIYLINNRVYYLRIKLKNGQSFNYYFPKSIKYIILEKVKIIRGKL